MLNMHTENIVVSYKLDTDYLVKVFKSTDKYSEWRDTNKTVEIISIGLEKV